MSRVGLRAGALTLAMLVTTSAFAVEGGGGGGEGTSSGGDREPAGGAFMSSYPAPGSTGVQAYGAPRSVDIPRNGSYLLGDRYAPDGQGPRGRRW